jgi:tRNA pseudouridine38-40 synthase
MNTDTVGTADPLQAQRTLLLLVEYDGTDLQGWQQQAPGSRTVQGLVRAAVRRMTGADPKLRASSRTDAGVHALGLPVTFQTAARIPLVGFLRGLNTLLPADVSVRSVQEVPDGFDARDAARGKRYRYDVWNGPGRSALRARWSWWVRGAPLDRAAMQAAGRHLLGEHDFSSFRATHCDSLSVHRNLTRLDVTEPEPHLVRVTVEGNAFLRNMVRIIAGTLVAVGQGQRRADDIPALLAARDRTQGGQTAPAHGLTLERVFYDLPAECPGVGEV